MVCAVTGAWADSLSGGGSYTVADGVVTFSGTPAGAIAAESNLNVNGATRIKFDNTCEINKDDLMRFLSGNNYYIDLLDITNGTNTPMHTGTDEVATNIDKIIRDAVDEMVELNNAPGNYTLRQAKGIILPLNTSLGTSKVEKPFSLWGGVKPTFSEYAVYYRSNQEIATIYAHDTNVKDTPASAVTQAQTNYNTAYAHLTENRTIGADIYMVSTNNQNRIDLSSTIPSGKTKISIINDEMVYRETLANIYVETSGDGGKFAAAVENTNIEYTPCNQLVIEGPINGADVAAVNEFNKTDDDGQPLEGPHVYNFAATTGATKAMLSTITNSKLEYIVLPNAMATEQIVASDFNSSLTASTNTNFKAAIAPSADKKKLSAYVKQAGSLGMARYYATGGSINNNTYSPNKTNLTDVILSGYLNASDIIQKTEISGLDENGHWGNVTQNVMLGLDKEAGINSFDLENAVFETQSDMNFYKAGYEKLTSVILPKSNQMTIIPENCLQRNASLTEICIPYNYEVIEDGAFNLTGLNHITTTDAKYVEIDNGPLTYTFSENLKRLGKEPQSPREAVATQVFPHEQGVLEIYSRATKTPLCYRGVFPANSCYGYGGYDSSKPYSRDRYFNGGDAKNAFAVLRFPSEETYDQQTNTDMKDTSYELMKRQYTDVNKEYSMKEQTGAVDANGDPILWPTRTEANRTFNQASKGLTWNDWRKNRDDHTDAIEGGKSTADGQTGIYTYTENSLSYDNFPAGVGDGDYSFAGYEGWHQIVLSQATYFEPTEKIVEDEVVTREYEQVNEWFTFCIPFSITEEQLQRMLGVPASTDKVINKVYYSGGTTVMEERSEGINPEVRTLNGVVRKPATAGKPNTVTFQFTRALVQKNSNAYYYWNINETSPASSDVSGTGNLSDNKTRIAIRGGLPYIVKPYKLKGENIKNLGKYIMERFSDEFKAIQSCSELGTDFYEQLGNANLMTSQFVKPYEKHKIQALLDDGNNRYATHENGKKYYYTFIGQFWEQPLPQYSFYVVNGKWYRYSSGTKNYKWAPYKCIIMATQEDDTDTRLNSGKFRDATLSNYPSVLKKVGNDEIFDGLFKLGFLKGLDDDDFDKTAGSRHIFALDEDIIEYDEDGDQVTGITKLDGEDITPMPVNMKVYNMAGQYVGNSVENIAKGMYIVNGKKVVVE